MNLLISLYDRTGNWSRPYLQAGWFVVQIDLQAIPYEDESRSIQNIDIMEWDYKSVKYFKQPYVEKIVILAAQPCTDYAVSGAKHFEAKDNDGRTIESQTHVAKTNEIIKYFNPYAWAVENPKTRLHKMNEWIGQRPKYVFNPCDFAGYNPDNPEDDRYNKETWLFGKFNDPLKKRLEPLGKEYPGFKNLGGKSLETKNARSITPLGFAFAFYQANH